MDSPVFVLDGGDVSVFASIAEAASGTEVYDIDTLRYIDADGTVLHATADGYQVRLAPTAERQPEELRARLEAFLGNPRVRMDPVLASDPRRVAALLADRQRTELWPRWPEWLHRAVPRLVRDVEVALPTRAGAIHALVRHHDAVPHNFFCSACGYPDLAGPFWADGS